ncbi:MAG: hypothetical protein OIF38_08575, partial [Cellvibrionaceae bacterium]|nr:hypothetical protein [Cellvibrionaceae bacterium]
MLHYNNASSTMPTFSRHLAICSLSLSVSLFFLIGAAPSQAEADFQVCQACHGAKAEGNAALGAPALAGQLHDYLLRAMEEFAQGQRQNPQMAAVVASLQDSQRRARLANYLST